MMHDDVTPCPKSDKFGEISLVRLPFFLVARYFPDPVPRSCRVNPFLPTRRLMPGDNMPQNLQRFMREAIKLSRESVSRGGGPFAAIIVKDGTIVSRASNSVTLDNDPTAHAEVNAIRLACRILNTFDLSGCTIFTSCEPCPMCLGAIYWARLDKVYYGNTKSDAAEIGFDDAFIYQELDIPPEKRAIPMLSLLPEEAREAFTDWERTEDKVPY